MLMAPQFHLASASPRRREVLAQQGYAFDLVPADVAETPAPGEAPADYARRVALAKALAGAAWTADALPVLGADTDVVVDGAILGKPRDRDEALSMLARLSARRHEVHSAVALVAGARRELVHTVTEVEFGAVTPAAAAAYWASGEPSDKAGAYAIQGRGAGFVRAIRGSVSGVVGLPLYETIALLAAFGIHPARGA